MSNITYTAEQQAALKAGAALMSAPANSSIIIKGKAGTGKSTLMRGFPRAIDNLIKTYALIDPDFKPIDVYYTATTHTACKNLGDIVYPEQTQTIHSLLGLRPKKDYKTNTTYLVRNPRTHTITDSLIIIDEAGMMDNELIEGLFKYTENCKFIFLGDPCQLTPVGLSYTPVFNMDFPCYTLTHIKRQGEGTPLEQLNIDIASSIEDGSWPTVKIDDKTIIHLNHKDFCEEIVKDIPNWANQEHTSKVLAWTNQRVEEYNGYFREAITRNSDVIPGDVMIANHPTFHPSNTIQNNEIVTIETVENTVVEIGQCRIPGKYITLRYRRGRFFLPDNLKDFKANPFPEGGHNRQMFLKLVDTTWVDLRYTYASTINKAQGATYDTVYIDLDDINKCNNPDMIKRMLYVAITRAKNKVVFTGDISRK